MNEIPPSRPKSDIKGVVLITLISVFFLGASAGFVAGIMKLFEGNQSVSVGKVMPAGIMALFWGSIIVGLVKKRHEKAIEEGDSNSESERPKVD